jgi:hypothetical protein
MKPLVKPSLETQSVKTPAEQQAAVNAWLGEVSNEELMSVGITKAELRKSQAYHDRAIADLKEEQTFKIKDTYLGDLINHVSDLADDLEKSENSAFQHVSTQLRQTIYNVSNEDSKETFSERMAQVRLMLQVFNFPFKEFWEKEVPDSFLGDFDHIGNSAMDINVMDIMDFSVPSVSDNKDIKKEKRERTRLVAINPTQEFEEVIDEVCEALHLPLLKTVPGRIALIRGELILNREVIQAANKIEDDEVDEEAEEAMRSIRMEYKLDESKFSNQTGYRPISKDLRTKFIELAKSNNVGFAGSPQSAEWIANAKFFWGGIIIMERVKRKAVKPSSLEGFINADHPSKDEMLTLV